MKNKHEVTININGEEWTKALDKSFDKNVQKVKVDGFRAGKCPRNVYEKKFGKESLFMDAVDFVLPVAFKKAIDESKLEPIVQPSVDIKKIDNDGVEFLFTIVTKPSIKIKKYKNLKVKKPEVKVTEKEIDEEVETLRKQYAEIIIKDAPIENGDTAVIDFEGFLNDKPFEGGKGENYPLEIGSNTFIPGFEEQLIGLKAGDKKDVNVSFPDSYPSEDLKGKPVVFKIKVHEVKTRRIPELNEDFFLDLGIEGIKDIKDLNERLKKDILVRKENAAEGKYVDELLESVSKEVETDIPEELIEAEVTHMVEHYEERLKMQGINLEQYLQFTKSNIDELKAKLRKDAEKNVLYRLTIEEIAKLENISISEEELNGEVEKLSKDYQMAKEELIKAFGGTEMIKYDLEMRKTINFLKENN
jgi:trigger factor